MRYAAAALLLLSILSVAGGGMGASCVGIGSGERDSTISVTGIDAVDGQRFTYAVENTRVLRTGTIEEFTVPFEQTELFDRLRRDFKVFAESDDRIQLVYGNQVYTVRKHKNDENPSYNEYALYGEYFRVSDGETLVRFPFPTDKILGYDQLESGIYGPPLEAEVSSSTNVGFSISCDLKYLETFYALYGPHVQVDGNTIRYGKISIVVKDGGRVQLIVP